jgi:hypothetical protein
VTDMTVYFKATRLDGTDFYTGRVLYAVGKCVRPLSFAGRRGLCGAGCLHAADVPAETLIGGWWPCRLFEVTGISFVSDDWHKHGFRQLSVVREIDSHLALGPNGREVAALIDRAGRLTPEEAELLYGVWGARWNAAGNAAWDVAGGAARNAAWVAAGNAASNAAGNAAAGVAARIAASALVVRDLITLEHFDTLYGPWESVIG